LATLSTKVKIYYLHGNRDFLLGADFLNKTGMVLLSDPCKIAITSTEYVLCHGDSLCTADIGYQIFRSWVRKPWIQKIFLSLPLHWRRAIANYLRSNSGMQYQRSIKSAAENDRTKMDVTLAACAAVLREQHATRLIHGHTHQPALHQESAHDQAWQRWVLSDWDLDHPESGRPRANAIMINQAGVSYTDLIKNENL
jgi:UDP-2,3-diacylglucosamine hydrolase